MVDGWQIYNSGVVVTLAVQPIEGAFRSRGGVCPVQGGAQPQWHQRRVVGSDALHQATSERWTIRPESKANLPINLLITVPTRLGFLTKDLDCHMVGASMVIILLFFGYQKWFAYDQRF
jgi:hypothetical protein